MNRSLTDKPQIAAKLVARKIILSGKVQGVGFRPFVFRIANQNQLKGWVKNCLGRVEIQLQGQSHNIENFLADLFNKKPPLAKPSIVSDETVNVSNFDAFSILDSERQGDADISVPNDLYLCDDCLAELNNPEDRRYRYPFINCTQCGPRYTLIRGLPYDRLNTTMTNFTLCPSCQAEYEDPNNRRFHAEPVACNQCGPSLIFHDNSKDLNQRVNKNNELALQQACNALERGDIIAVKGIGGYHLLCDATNTKAVNRLRKNKPRPDKPLAVMFPAPIKNPFQLVDKYVTLTETDKDFLLKPERAILLVAKKPGSVLSTQIAAGLSEVGVMLPYSPLHHLLLNDIAKPLVATSANISGEPVLTENQEVEKRLSHVADAYLHHDRQIARPADDPVYRTIADKPRPIRTGRGSAPLEIKLPFTLSCPILAVGAHMKNTVTLAWKDRAVISPHIGEMDRAKSFEVFENTIFDLQNLYQVKPERIISDAHPSYTTSRWANKQKTPVTRVYHHHAHASAAYYECKSAIKTDETILAFTWDGVGYGEDGTLWGGETFLGKPGEWKRVASMKPFYLPGADKAGREPWRSAAALCWEVNLPYENIPEKDPLLKQAWAKKINTPQTSSVGRMFDAVVALTGVCVNASFEGQGPMELESRCYGVNTNLSSLIDISLIKEDNLLIYNWDTLLTRMLESTLSVAERASIFHHSLAHCILKQAQFFRDECGVEAVTLSGGVFQNQRLTEQAMTLLADNGFTVCLPELIPVNDAGISFGQVIEYGFTS